MKRIIITVLLSLFVTTGAAAADTKVHRASQIQFWLPDSWTVEGEEADQLEASDPKGQVALLFMIRDAKDMKGALATIDEAINQLAKNVKSGKPKKVDINGMEASVVDATGKVDGKPVELSVLVVKTPANKFLTVFGVIEVSAKKRHEADLVKILQSLRPAKASKFGK
jgi:hypothetical protein